MSTTKRIASIDLIRGIAITGMILCANIGFNSDLPAWMFHAQTPPPTYAFNPDVPGITWVDLVFPFFLFPMGAAFPLAMRKRLEKGQSIISVAGSLVKRWAILTLFALLLGNAYAIWGTTQPAWQVYVFYIAVWAGMFLSLVRVNRPGRLGMWVNLSGIAMLTALGFVFTRHFGIALNRYASDIIIMILANIALWGGLIWMFTRDNLKLRWIVFLLIASVKALSSYAPQALSFVPSCGSISWLFNYEFLQYLLIAIPGSIIGDMIMKHSRSGAPDEVTAKGTAGGFVALAAVVLQLWGLFTRNVLADFILSAMLCISFIALTWKNHGIAAKTGFIGFALMLTGIIFDPIDGGITKDHCNLSYVLTTGGMAALVTSFLLTLELRFGVKGPFLAGVGQNPMIAYTVTTFLIGPVLNLIGFLPWLYGLAAGSPFWGVMQGVIITFLMMCATYSFTRLKLFWRS